MNNIYKLLSCILMPPMIALYAIVSFSLFSPIGLGSLNAFSSIAIGVVFLVLVPLGSAYYFNRGNIDVDKKEDRVIPYLVGIVSYLIASSIFWLLNAHIMFVISMAYVFVTSAISIINIFWKISAHTAGVAGPTTALIYVFGLNLIPLYALTLLVIWIRLKLKAHNMLQLMTGAIVAIFITSLVYTILW